MKTNKKKTITQEQRETEAKKGDILIGVYTAIIVAYFFMSAKTIEEEGYSFFNALFRSIRFQNGFFSIDMLYHLPFGLLCGALIGFTVWFVAALYTRRTLTYKTGESKGTARLMTAKERDDYIKSTASPETEDSKPNIVLSYLTRRPINGKVLGNNNVFVMGGSGSGKSFAYVKTNLMQMYGSYIITDPSGELITSTGKMLRMNGYKIKIFNISDMTHSSCYNPLKYIRDEAGVMMVVETLIKNTTGKGSKGEEFFVNAEKLVYSACIFYLLEFCTDDSKKNFATVMNMINMSQIDENDPNAQESPLDKLFKPLPTSSMAAKYYKAFKQAAGKTLKSIIISCVTRLQPFMVPQVINLTNTDEMELEKLGFEKTALFIITPAADRTYAFLASMLYSQMFETLYYVAEEQLQRKGSEKLPVPVMALMDEFANIGEVPEFPEKLATMRKYNISASVILQDLSQLKAMYEKEWASIISNCSTWLFLSATEQETLEYFSKKTGTGTIKVKSKNYNHGKQKGESDGIQETERAVFTEDELARLDKDDCIVYFQNQRPIKDEKFYANRHDNWKYCDGTTDNNFNYKTMPAYDVGRIKLSSLHRANAEANRVRGQSFATDPMKASDVKFDGSHKSVLQSIFPVGPVAEKAFHHKLNKVLDAIANHKEITDSEVPFVLVEGVPLNELYKLAVSVKSILRKNQFFLFANNKKMYDDPKMPYMGICIDSNRNGLLEAVRMSEPGSFEIKKDHRGKEYAEVGISEIRYEEFKETVLLNYKDQKERCTEQDNPLKITHESLEEGMADKRESGKEQVREIKESDKESEFKEESVKTEKHKEALKEEEEKTQKQFASDSMKNVIEAETETKELESPEYDSEYDGMDTEGIEW